MPEESQDRIIREKLAQLQIPFMESDWEAFVREYPDAISIQMDQLISSSLSTLEVEPTPGDWELFEQMLPADAPVISMVPEAAAVSPIAEDLQPEEGIAFPDELFRDKLTESELPFEQADWELMASRLDGNLFDQAIRNSLEHYQIPVQAGDWQDMAASMDAPMYASFKDHLGTMEVSFRHADWRIFSRDWLGHRPWYLEWRNFASAAAVILLLLSVGVTGILSSTQQQPAGTLAITNLQDANRDNHSDPAPGPDQAIVSSETNADQLSGTYQPGIGYSPQGSIESSLRELRPVYESDDVSAELTVREALQVPARVDRSANARIQKIRQRDANWQTVALPTKAPAWTQWFTPKNHLHSFSVGLYGAYGNTRAELSARKGTPGYTTGLRVELGLSEDLALVSGLQYESRGFSHRYFSFTPGQSTVENRITADFHMAEIPLLLKYYLPAAPKVRVFGQTGIIAMVSMQENYQLFQNSASTAPLPGVSGSNLRLANPASEQRRSLETYIGNIFGGVGISVEATERLNIQVEPYMLLSLQNTKGSGALGVEKRMYHAGVGFSLLYRLK